MAKDGSNPMNSYHRQKRKKELDKNKKARIAARDEQVVQSKSVAEISKQIEELEKRGSAATRNHGELMKLQRLQKELKLVKEAAAKAAAEAAAGKTANNKHQQQQAAAIQKQQQQFKLDDARKSVYYDATMNPYGAPPPGKPRLYHCRGGGTTMNADYAVVPGLEEEQHKKNIAEQPQYIKSYGDTGGEEGSAAVSQPSSSQQQPVNMRRQDYRHTPPPPPPPRQQHQQQQSHYRPQQQQRTPQHHTSSRHTPPPPPPPPPLPNGPPPPPPPPPKDAVPSLPKPSASVARTNGKNSRKRNALAADIWASTEEVTYHRKAHGMDLEEGTVEKQKDNGDNDQQSTQKPNDVWYYYDTYQQLQGPFTAVQMTQWNQAGYFPPNTLVRNGTAFAFVPVGTVVASGNFATYKRQVEKKPKKKKQKKAANDDEIDDDVQARINALRPSKPPVEDDIDSRIQALRKQEEAPVAEEEVVDDVQARIEALRADGAKQQQVDDENNDVQARIEALRNGTAPLESQDATAPSEQESIKDDMQARIDALRNGPAKEDREVAQDRIDALRNRTPDAKDAEESDAMQARIDALRSGSSGGDHQEEFVELPHQEAAPYPAPAAYPEPAPYPEPAAYPESATYPEPAVYPAGDDNVTPAYPLMDEVAPYPVDDAYYPTDVAYPVMDAYPVDDAYPVNDTYPTNEEDVSAYPVPDDVVPAAYAVPDDVVPDDRVPTDVAPIKGEKSVEAIQVPLPKKVVKVDKEIIGFLPTNLQKRRATAKKPTRKRATPKLAPLAKPVDALPKTEDVGSIPNEKTKSVGEDYDLFMKEISNL